MLRGTPNVFTRFTLDVSTLVTQLNAVDQMNQDLYRLLLGRDANSMWRRILQVDDPSKGKVWDRSLIYIATDFGRTMNTQQEGSRGSAHDLNSKTYGFDPMSGEAQLGRNMNEKDTYSLICQALGVDFQGSIFLL